MSHPKRSIVDSAPDDLLNVRLQTLGVIEHSFDINMSGTKYVWKLYDVGGAVRENSSESSYPSFLHPDINLIQQRGQASLSQLHSGYMHLLRFRCFRFDQRHTWVPYFDDGTCPQLASAHSPLPFPLRSSKSRATSTS